MAENSKIEWTHHTFNPWVGCTKISPACDNCYAEAWSKRSGMVQWGASKHRVRTSAKNWKQPLKWNAEAEQRGVRYRVFCASLADVFDNAVESDWRRDLFSLIERTQNLDWLLLTKRISNARAMLNECAFGRWDSTPLPNVWLGATVCNQEEADRDIPKLLTTPAAVRFLSVEPMLGHIYLDGTDYHVEALAGAIERVDWVICGGESSHNARPMQPTWARSLRDQCAEAGVPFLFKQWGEWEPIFIKEGCAFDKPGDLASMVCSGKNNAGRVLDGMLHDGYPKGA